MKKIIPALIFGLLFVLIVVYSIFNFIGNKTIMNDGYVNGNTAGNLYNAGLFCEKDGKVYFSNPDDNGCLYVMDSDNQNLKKLSSDTVMYINVDDHYIYYVRNNDVARNSSEYPYFSYNNNSLCRINLDGSHIKILDEDPCIYASLSGNYIYYLHYDSKTATTLYKVRIDGEEKKQVLPYYVFNCSMVGPNFYYSGTQDDGNLYVYNTQNDSVNKLYDINCYKPIAIDSSNFYYQDYEDNFTIKHVNTSFDTINQITTDSVDLFNIYGSTVFYQRYSENSSGLCRIQTDGSSYDEIALGDYENINVTSHYVYFKKYGSNDFFYTSTSSDGPILSFHPGIDDSFKK